jgi:acylphosphatase
MTDVARRVVVQGRVQGVGFRYAMIAMAAQAGVVGWVRNRHDGTVEAHLQGEATAVERVLAWARRGPPGARVTEVQVEPVARDDAHDRFEQRPTA